MSPAAKIRAAVGVPIAAWVTPSSQTVVPDLRWARLASPSCPPALSPQQKSADFVASQIKNMPNVASKPQNPTPTVTPTVAPTSQPPQQSIQQYPTYNQQQSSVTIIPIMMGGDQGGGGGQQQKPVFIPVGGGGGGGGGTIILPGPSEGAILNSLWKTMLLTNLSAA